MLFLKHFSLNIFQVHSTVCLNTKLILISPTTQVLFCLLKWNELIVNKHHRRKVFHIFCNIVPAKQKSWICFFTQIGNMFKPVISRRGPQCQGFMPCFVGLRKECPEEVQLSFLVYRQCNSVVDYMARKGTRVLSSTCLNLTVYFIWNVCPVWLEHVINKIYFELVVREYL